jgi:hypothetical protein
MPGYKSKTQSKTQSKKNLKSSNKAKNGGRRRKQTMKKVRRGRKVMRGGADTVRYDLLKTTLENDKAMESFLKTMAISSWDEFQRVGDGSEIVNIKKIYDTFFKDTDSPAVKTFLDLLSRKSD